MTPTAPVTDQPPANLAEQPVDSPPPQPVGQGDYLVAQGECISSIAKEKGYFWETIWNHGPNSELKTVRKDPNILLPGDRVTLPPKSEKQESGATEMRHRFVRRGEPCGLRIRVLKNDDTPRANQPYTLEVEGTEQTGTTDHDGYLTISIRGDSHRGLLTVGPPEDQVSYELALGNLDPIEEISGVQSRLENLGYGLDGEDGVMGPNTVEAIRDFQDTHGLTANGELDPATRAKLLEVHGS